MASSLILNKRISTTTAKAKALRTYVEPLITKTKDLTTVHEQSHAQRVVFSYLQDKLAVKELFKEVAPRVATRPGGYTRILKTGSRLGDNAEMCIIELVDYNENLLSAKEDSQKSSRRRRRTASGKKTEAAAVVEEKVVKEEAKVEEPIVQETSEVPVNEVTEEKPAEEDTKEADDNTKE